MKLTVDRRTFVTTTAAALTARALRVDEIRAQGAVPNSSGTEPPKLKAPASACDCHHHIYDSRYPFSQPGARMVRNARVADYRLLQRRLVGH
jgi:D-galactarolactone isomerase